MHPKAEHSISSRFAAIWLLVLMLLAARLATNGNDYYYSPDEAMLVNMASGGTLQEVWENSLFETHPPLGNFLRHYWMGISTDIRFVRSLSLLFGLALIPLYYLIGNLLSSRLLGMSCALLIACSRGVIIQSYVARNYILFLFFISTCFWCLLYWRKNRRSLSVVGYAAFGCLAAVTHFSAVFAAACMGFCEMVVLLRTHASLKLKAQWLAANAAIALTTGFFYLFWLPVLAPLKSYFSLAGLGLKLRLLLMLRQPLGVPFYAFPSLKSALPLLITCFIVALVLKKLLRKQKDFPYLLALLASAIVLGMTLFITDIYTPVGGRHNMWVFPFFIPAAGWMLSATIAAICSKIAQPRQQLWSEVVVILTTVAGWALYSPADRFSDKTEYSMLTSDYEQLKAYISGLGFHYIVLMERDDAVMFINIYPYLKANHITPDGKNDQVIKAEYGETRLLFHSGYRRLYNRKMLQDFYKDIKEKHLAEGSDSLVFFYSLWPHSIAARLMLCDPLQKQVYTFPPYDGRVPLTPDDIYNARAAYMIVSRHDFEKQVLAPDGKAADCIKPES